MRCNIKKTVSKGEKDQVCQNAATSSTNCELQESPSEQHKTAKEKVVVKKEKAMDILNWDITLQHQVEVTPQ